LITTGRSLTVTPRMLLIKQPSPQVVNNP
jgi:hypothetical protein